MAKKTKSGRKSAYSVRKGAASKLFDFKGIRKFVAGIGKKLSLF